MDFSLNDEQAMLKDSVVQYLSRSYSFEERMEIVRSKHPFDDAKWQEFAELGWLSLPFSTDDDGFGGGPVELMVLMQELGRHLVIEPYLANVVLGGGCIAAGSNQTMRQKLLPALMDGTIQLALAYAEPDSRFQLADIRSRVEPGDSAEVLNGEKIMVLNGASADYLIVAARTSGDVSDKHGITLYCVKVDQPGITVRGYKTVDGQHAANIRFDNVPVMNEHQLCDTGLGFEILDQVITQATLAVAAEALGILETLTYKTIDYTKERQQFGVPLSSFQALQHRMVDMFMELEQSRSLLLRAAIKCQDQAEDAAASVAAIKYYIGTAGRKVGEEAVQLHGGMGVTDEMDVAHMFKRLTVIDTMFGNSDYQLARYLDA